MIDLSSHITTRWRSQRLHQICAHVKWRTFFQTLIVILIVRSMVILFSTSFSFSIGSFNNNSHKSRFQFVKFRNIDSLIDLCEQKKTIGCPNYLHHNQSDYFQVLSPQERDTFQRQYCTKTKKMLFHTFWDNIDTLHHILLRLHIQSFLYTQNLQCSKMIVWVLPKSADDDNKTSEKDTTYEPHVEFRTLSLFSDDLAQVGVNITSEKQGQNRRSFLPAMGILSDVVRFVVLNRLGGLYVDADVLLLRDFQPLYVHEFAYRWSSTQNFNTAVLRLFPQSNTSTIVNNKARAQRSPLGFHPISIGSYSLLSEFKRLPCIFFDPLWLAVDGKDPFAQQIWQIPTDRRAALSKVFKQQDNFSRRGRTLFDGAFAHHWHALHVAGKPQNESYMDQWYQMYESELFNTSSTGGKKLTSNRLYEY